MAELMVIFGPPGTGKTTTLKRVVEECVVSDGNDTILLTAFTKTAAHELASRGMGVEEQQIGTLHSHCFHALDEPNIAEGHLADWNEVFPMYQLSTQDAIYADHEMIGESIGDDLLNQLNLLRHRLEPRHHWPERVQHFARQWTDWKAQHHYCDFTDLIEKSFEMFPVAPRYPKSIIVDEAQDLTLLQWKLLLSWAKHADRFIAAGDDDQCLYQWAGADFAPMLSAPQRTVLTQSYRVPRSVQRFAMRFCQSIAVRQAKTWAPRDMDGTVEHLRHISWRHPEYALLPKIREWLEMPFGTVGIFAPCSYMLAPMVRGLKEAGLPFYNPWRAKDRFWNPLRRTATEVTPTQRLLAFLKPPERLWTWPELGEWVPMLRNDMLLPGAHTRVLGTLDTPDICGMRDLESLLTPPCLSGALQGGIRWLADVAVTQKYRDGLRYPLQVFLREGREGLTEDPRIILGNIHSTKGGEVDICVLFMDLSHAQKKSRIWDTSARDNILRTLYVGSTRARESLFLCGERDL